MAKKLANGKGKKTTTCVQCGKSFEAYICHLEAGRSKFCSYKCSGEYKHVSGMKTVVCEQCGKEFEIIKSSDRKFCSNKCSGKAGRTRKLVKCLNCGKEFYSVPARLKDGRGKYCSKECSLEHKQARTIKCLRCGKKIKVAPSQINIKKYCSWDCANMRSPIVRICKACGKEFTVKFPSITTQNCSKACAASHRKISGYGYEAAVERLGWVEKIRRDPKDKNAAQFKCYNCGKWFTPTRLQVSDRIKAVERDTMRGELHLYCSDDCKTSCSIYGQVTRYSWEKKPRTHDVVDNDLVGMVLNRDSYQCQKCGATEDLNVHHIEGVAQEPMLANDIDNCITVCHSCHVEIHSQPGCTFADYQRVACEDSKEAINQTIFQH